MRPAQLSVLLDQEFEGVRAGHHTPVMLWGPPGVGKSQLVNQAAARTGDVILDLAGGTGDLARAFSRKVGPDVQREADASTTTQWPAGRSTVFVGLVVSLAL